MPVTVDLGALEDALLWVSSPPELECSAHVARSTGRVFCRGADGPLDPDAPDDLDDPEDCVELPHRNDLELGRTLVFRFVDAFAPQLSEEVHRIFHRRGAYARFKALLQRRRLLDRWHDHEREATREALARWATENGFTVDRASRGEERDRGHADDGPQR